MFGPARAAERTSVANGLLESLMHWTRVSLFCLGAALLASSNPASAQVINEQTGVVQLEDYSGSMSLSNDGGSWMQVDRMSGDGVGFQSGYTRIGIRTKLLDFGASHVFSELNGTMNDHGRLGTNLGMGYRTMYDAGVLGVHGWYDNYESNYGHHYQQATVGGEYLHQWLDLRVNGYMPFGNRDNFIGVVDPGTELAFQGNDFGTLGRGQIERSLAGFDAEAGVPLPVATFLKLFGGTYYLNAKDGDDTWGVRSRLEARIGDGATLNFQVTDDNMFGTNLNFGATVWYGGGPTSPFKFQRDRSGWARRYDPVRRAQPVQLQQDRNSVVFVPLNNTDTGNRFNITWVDNTNAAPGDGTFENPFTNLPGSAPGSDHILVRTGVGNTTGNIVLEDNQKLWGEGRVYTLNTDRLGTVEIPDQFFSQAGPRPTLAPAAGFENVPIVTLANNNQVINFNMTGGTAPGIFGNVVNDFRIEHVNITSDIGIFINDASGLGILNDIQVPNVAAGQTGVFIRNTGGDTLNLVATDISTTGGDFGMQVYADGAVVNTLIDGLEIVAAADTGLVLDQRNNGELNATVRNAAIGSNDVGILVSSNTGAANVTLDNVEVTGNGNLLNVVGVSTFIGMDVTNSTFSNSAAGSGIVINVDGTIGDFDFENIVASGNFEDGFRLNATNASLIAADIIDSDVSFNGDNNFEVNANGGSVVNFFVDPTTATDSGNDGFLFTVVDPQTVINATFIDVDLSRAGQSAISGLVDNEGLVRLFLTNVQASDSGLNGLDVSVNNTSDFFTVIRDSSFTRSGQGNNGRGVNLLVTNNSNVFVDMDGTPANNNGAEGLHYEVLTGVDGASSIIGFVSNGNFSDNPVNNVFGLVSGANSFANWTFTDVTADLLAANSSVELTSLAGGRQDIVWSGINSSISGGDADGVNLTALGVNSVLNFAFSDGRINDNAGQGIDALAAAGGRIRIDLNNAEVNANVNENILAAAFAGSQVIVNATNSNLSDGGLTTNLDNVLLLADGPGALVGGIFDGVTLDNSGLHGLHALIVNDGSLDLQFLSSDPANPGSASNNLSGSGIRIEAAAADSISVASSGNSIISGNLNDNVDVDIAGANFAFIQIAGQMDGSLTGDGVNVNLDGVLSGGIDIGPGSASDNANDGVNILVANSTLDQGISVTGLTATGNGGEPITVVTTNSTITGGSIDGNVTDGGNNGISWTSDSGTVDVNITNNVITGASDNGILVTLNGTAIGNEVHIDFNSVSGDGAIPLNGIQLNLANDAQLLTGTITGNGASGAANYGVLVGVTDNALVDSLTIDGNALSGAGIDGLLYTASGNTTLNSLVVSDNIADQNGSVGLNVLLDSVNGNGTVEFRGNLATGNGNHGILLTGIDTSLTAADFLGNEASGNGGDGIQFNLSSPGGTSTLGSVAGFGNIADGNTGVGIHLALDGFDTAVVVPDVILEGNIATGNGLEGVAVNVSNMDAGVIAVIDSNMDGNGADGLRVSLTNNATDTVAVLGNTAGNNAFNGLNYQADGASAAVLAIVGNVGVSSNGEAGILVGATNGSNIDLMVIDSNEVVDNGTHGIQLTVTGASTLPAAGSGFITNNTITGHQAGDGVNIVTPDTGGTDFGIAFEGNTISGNTGGSGVNLTLNGDSGVVTSSFINNDLSGNGGSGLLANLTQTADLQIVDFQDNTVDGNGQMGVRVLTGGTSNFLLDGSAGGNTFDGNAAAGIGAVLSNASTADIRIANSSITNTTAGGIAGFNGQGVRVFVQDTAQLLGGSQIDFNTISGNNGNGVDLLAIDFGVIGGMTINDNIIASNGTNGVRIERQESGAIGSAFDRLEISGNVISGASEGVFIIAANTNSTDFYEMNDNEIVGMTLSGVHFEVRADADIDVNMDNNLISNNGLDGILVTDQINAPADSRSVTGFWTNNEITNNGRHGINLAGSTDLLVIGDIFAPGFPPPLADGNLIAGNNNDGISITGPGSVIIAGNLITENGSNGADDAGIDFSGASFNDVTIVNNAIVNNRGDGIEYEGDGVFGSIANISGNNISFNDGRGFDLLVQPSGSGSSSVDMTFNNNIVANNGEEGVYVIFTASRNQTQSGPSTAALLADGNFTDSPFLRMAMDGNSITANGINSGFSTTGLVVRVGTTQASTSTTDSGGFASNGAGVFTRSGVIMDVTNNNFGGNFGNDIYFDSFTSTNPPPVSAGTWGTTDDPTVITTYRADPLARLDLTFSDNSFDSVAVNNVGAFYDTNEATFKSRANNANAPNQGPFPAGSSDRRRNAQRLASRYSTNPPGLAPNTDGIPDSYLYPGMGDSTFRVRGNQTGLFLLDNPALVGDPNVVDAVFEANGVLRPGSIAGELPYGWGLF